MLAEPAAPKAVAVAALAAADPALWPLAGPAIGQASGIRHSTGQGGHTRHARPRPTKPLVVAARARRVLPSAH